MPRAGTLTFVGEFDGRRLTPETVAAAKEAGAAGGAAYSSDFGKKFDGFAAKLRTKMIDEGRKNGLVFSKSFTDRISNAFSDVRGKAAELGGKISAGLNRAMGPIDTLRLKAMYLRDNLASLSDSKTLGPFSKLFNIFRRDGVKAFQDVGGAGDGLGAQLAKAGASSGSLWDSFSTNGKQAILIVAAIAAAAGPIAVLGSAAAGGLLILGGAVGALAVGVGVLIAGFQNVMGDISKLPAAAQPAAAAIQGLVAGFKGMQVPIQAALLQGLAGPIDLVTKTLLPVLTTGLVGVAGAVNGVLGQLATALASPAAVTAFQALLAGFQPIISSLGSALITFGGGLGNVFVAALPFVAQFASWFSKLGDQFLAWTSSVAGNTAITSFFQTTMTVFAALEPLIGAVGQLFSSLVTPASIATTVQLLGILTQIMGPLASFLDMASNLQLFNIIAAAIQLVLQGLQPLMPVFTQLGLILSGAVIQTILALIPAVQMIASAFIPFISVLNTILQTVLPPLIPIIGQLGTFLGGVLSSALMLITPLLTMLIPVFSQIMAAIMPIISAILPPLNSLLMAIIPILTPIISLFTSLLTPILALISPLLELIGPILNPLIDLLTILMAHVVPILTTVISALTPVFTGVANAISSVLIPVIKTITDVLGGIITFITGVFTGNWKQAWSGLVQIFSGIFNGIKSTVRGVVNGVVDIINGLIGGVNTITSKVGIPAIPKIPHWASGALLTGPTFGLAGEAGPEAIVPLNRPLSQVDPAVRGLSAIAQGKAAPASVGGGGGGNVIFEAGSVVSPYSDPALVATQVADKVAEKIAV